MGDTPAEDAARRAAGGRFAENTLPAFRHALTHGADGIELDVILTADGELAVCHDEALNLHVAGADRRSRELGFVSGRTMAELAALDVGDGEAIPRLEAVLELAAALEAGVVNIELKGRDCFAAALGRARAVCARTGYPPERIVYSSFDHGQLAGLRRLDPQARLGALFELSAKGPSPLYPETPGEEMSATFSPDYADSLTRTVAPTSLHPFIGDYDGGAAAYAQARGLELFVWTMGEPPPSRDPWIADFVRILKDNPSLALITDFPAELSRVRAGG